jgi:hypothetical protein
MCGTYRPADPETTKPMNTAMTQRESDDSNPVREGKASVGKLRVELIASVGEKTRPDLPDCL